MTGLVSVAAGQPIRSTHVSQFSRWVQGATKDQSATFTTTHATEYTATLTNEETSAGNVLKLVSGASTIALFNKTGAALNVPLIATGVLAGLFSATGQIIYGSGGTGATTLNIGSTFQALIVNSGAAAPTYAASLQSLLASAGSMIGASAANTPAHIPKGTTAFMGLVMAAGATGQTWASCAIALAQTAGDTFYANGANSLSRLAPGSARFVLGLDANATATTWLASLQSLLTATGGVITATAANTPIAVFPTTSGQYFRSNATGAGFETVGAANTLDKLAETSGTGTSATLQFSAVSSSYRSLIVEYSGQSDTSAGFQTVQLTFESSPTAGAYNHVRLFGLGTAAGVQENSGTSSYIFAGGVSGTAAGTFVVGSGQITLPDYATTSIYKTALIAALASSTLAASGLTSEQVTGLWESTTAISLIRLTLAVGNWTTKSRATLWGKPA